MSIKTLSIGENAPEVLNVVIEIPARSNMKYEYDEETDVIKLDRVLHSPMFYPAEYGFVPETRAEDGDHLDVLVLLSQPTFPGCVLEVRPVGVLEMEDDGGIDWKVLCVSTKDSRFNHITHIDEVNSHTKDEIQHFFEQYKHLEQKWAEVRGWLDLEAAHKCIKESRERYQQENS